MINSETFKARGRLAKYCIGNGVDLGYGGDPITPSVIAIDQVSGPYTIVGACYHPQNLFGDARDLYWFKDNVLDFVYASHLLEDFEEEEIPAILKEWLRVLKPGGYLIIYGPDQKEYEKYSYDHGFTPNSSHKIPNYGFAYQKEIVLKYFEGQCEVVHAIELIDDYCFDLVVRKT